MAQANTTTQSGWSPMNTTAVQPTFNVVETTNVSSAADTESQAIFASQEALQQRPPYNYGQVCG